MNIHQAKRFLADGSPSRRERQAAQAREYDGIDQEHIWGRGDKADWEPVDWAAYFWLFYLWERPTHLSAFCEVLAANKSITKMAKWLLASLRAYKSSLGPEWKECKQKPRLEDFERAIRFFVRNSMDADVARASIHPKDRSVCESLLNNY